MDEKRYWLAWNMVGGVGPKRFSMLLAHFGGAEAAWHASPISAYTGFRCHNQESH